MNNYKVEPVVVDGTFLVPAKQYDKSQYEFQDLYLIHFDEFSDTVLPSKTKVLQYDDRGLRIATCTVQDLQPGDIIELNIVISYRTMAPIFSFEVSSSKRVTRNHRSIESYPVIKQISFISIISSNVKVYKNAPNTYLRTYSSSNPYSIHTSVRTDYICDCIDIYI